MVSFKLLFEVAYELKNEMEIKETIKEWESIWGKKLSLGSKEDLIKRIEILMEEKN